MKFKIKLPDIKDTLNFLIKSTASGDVVGKSLLVGTAENKILLSTTNNDGIISYAYIPAEILAEGEIIIEAKLLNNLIRKLPAKEKDLTFKIKGRRKKDMCLLLSVGNGEYEFDRQDDIEFPIPKSQFQWDYSLKAETLLSMLERSGWLFGDKMEEYSACEGVLFEFTDDIFNIISSDTVKFACSTHNIEDGQFETNSVIVPSKIIKLLMGHLKKAEEATIFIADEHVKFKIDNVNYVSSSINDTYPDIRAAFELDIKPESVLVNRVSLCKTLERLNLFTDKIRQMITFTLKPKKPIELTSHNIGTKKCSTEELPEHWGNKEQIYIGINGEKLFEIAKKMITDEMDLRFRGDNNVLEIHEPGNPDVYYILAPLRTD